MALNLNKKYLKFKCIEWLNSLHSAIELMKCALTECYSHAQRVSVKINADDIFRGIIEVKEAGIEAKKKWEGSPHEV